MAGIIRSHPFHDRQEAELARWLGVGWTRELRAKHCALILRFRDLCRFVVYPNSPGDGARGVQNHLRDLRQALQAMGAVREASHRSTQVRRERNPTEPSRLCAIEPVTGGPARDPWAALRTLIPDHDVAQDDR